MAETSAQIIPFYAHPHVHTVINDDTFYDEATSTPPSSDNLPYSTVVVTGADQGIDNTFIRLSDLRTKLALFGQGNFQKYGQSSLQADQLFNGSTAVWFCRVLPDNATYSNMILVANYRKGNILDNLGQETGLKRLEVKFTVGYAGKPKLTEGSKNDAAILEIANGLKKDKPDETTGYMTLPLFYVRSIGRGKYGNRYSMHLRRDVDAENEYNMKMYKFSLIENGTISKIKNIFSGSIYQTTRNNKSTMISDVLDQFPIGSAPVSIKAFDESIQKLFDFYKGVVEDNRKVLEGKTPTAEQTKDLEFATKLDIEEFDPVFGYVINSRAGEQIPYYRNYTVKESGPYVRPDQEVATASALKKNLSDWSTAKVGATVLVLADENNGGHRWLYKIASIAHDSGNIVYDEGVEAFADDKEYDGINVADDAGIRFTGGSDGDFQEITVKSDTRPPTEAEMKLLLSREYVKAFRGQKDRKILSPARVDVDFIFDANYNMTSEGLGAEDTVQSMYSNSTVLTDADYQQLAITAKSGAAFDVSDLNVKKAIYDLNEFRNRNGMKVGPDLGAGASLYLDSGIVGIKNVNASTEILDLIKMFSDFRGRATSIDLGHYSIFDPYSGKRIQVTVGYFLAQRLIPHIIQYGLNKPFAMDLAQLNAIQRDTAITGGNSMIRDSFQPDIDLIDWDVKELLYNNRFNYYLSEDEGRVVKRAVQNTRQLEASALLEENNVRVLNTLKKGLEKACRGYAYNWNEPEARKGYTDSQMAIYRPWIGTMVQDIEIQFKANEFEQKRMMMHCYCVVKFRDIIKRIILEINIQRPEYGGE